MSTLTGTQVLLLVASETGHVYTFATPKLQPLITKQEGKNLIQACLNSPDSMQATIPSQSATAAHHHHATASNLSDYLPTVNGAGAYENELTEEEMAASRSNSALNVAASHGYLPSGTTPTPPTGGSAASVAAAAAQVFMNSAGAGSTAASYANYSQSSGNPGSYWNGQGSASSAGMYAPVPNKSQQQHQQLHNQQQMYHALMQQQQLYQQYQQQQQQMQKQNNDSNDS